MIVQATPSDAITDSALQTRAELRRLGRSEVFARFIAPDTDPQVGALQDLPLGRATDVVIYHSGRGDPETTAALLQRPEHLVLVHHSINPTEFFADSEDDFAAELVRVRSEIMRLAHRVTVAIADSEADADDLGQLGFTEVHIASSGVHPDRLAGLSTDAETELELDEAVGVPFVVGVGELRPSHCQHVLLQALHVVQSVHRVELGLVMIGSAPNSQYARALHHLTHNLRLQHVWFAGRTSEVSRATILRRARLFGSASQEGHLGIHPLEAMTLGVPVVVRETRSVAEAVGRGALMLPASSGPLMLAEAFLMAHHDAMLRSSLIDSGFDRVSEFSASRHTRSLVDVIVAARLTS